MTKGKSGSPTENGEWVGADGQPFSGDQDAGAKTSAKRKRSAPKSKSAAGNQLRSYIERIERLNEEKAEIGDDIKSVFAEAKASGFDTKVMRRVIAIRKQETAEWQESQAVLDTYLHALGMIDQQDMFDPARELEAREREEGR